MRPRTLLLLLLIAPTSASASAGEAARSVLSMLLGLAIVLAAVYGMLLVMRRIQQRGVGAQVPVRVIGGTAVGARERVVLVEIADKVLVLGVAPGQIHMLQALESDCVPRPPKPDDTAPSPFQTQLQRKLSQLIKRAGHAR